MSISGLHNTSMNWNVEDPQRLDAFLADHMPESSRNQIQKMIKQGDVQVNEKVVKKASYTLKEGDVVGIDSPIVGARGRAPLQKQKTTITPADLGLDILYEDDACFVINKPAGYAMHGGTGMQPDERTILDGVAFLFEQKKIPFHTDSVLVHRLDKETTGCVLIAKNTNAHHHLQQQFAGRTTSKTYLALVAGVPDPAEAKIDAPIGRNLIDRTKMSVLRTSVSREAQTTYKVLDATNECALLQCDLHTGRTHQVRVHVRSIGHPILGDDTYGSSESEKLTKHFDIHSLCLHAWKLGFESPADNTRKDVEAPIPRSFSVALKEVGLQGL